MGGSSSRSIPLTTRQIRTKEPPPPPSPTPRACDSFSDETRTTGIRTGERRWGITVRGMRGGGVGEGMSPTVLWLPSQKERLVQRLPVNQEGLPQGLMSFRAFRMRAGSQGVKQRRRSHHHATAGGKPPSNHAGIPRNLGPMHSTALRARARVSRGSATDWERDTRWIFSSPSEPRDGSGMG